MSAPRGAGGPATMGASQLRAAWGSGLGDASLGLLGGAPLVVVELDDGDDVGPMTSFLDAVVVGVAGSTTVLECPPSLDILLCDDPGAPAPWVSDSAVWLTRLAAACGRSPAAAVALVQLLRFSPNLSVADALVAESFVYSMLQAGPEHRRWLAAHPARPVPHDERPAVVLERNGTTLAMTLNRPDRHNAYGAAMRDGLVSGFAVAVADPTIETVTLAGAGASFCSGGDLDEFGRAPDPVSAHAARVGAGAGIWAHRSGPMTHVDVHGACIGAGIELASFAASIRASPGTALALPEVGMGLVPGAGGTVSIPRRIGRQRTALMALTGVTLETSTALAWGLVDEVA